jgi:three-Cys-motif partner protein
VSSRNFHAQDFDEGTQAKLEIFQLYIREWLPVFLARNPPIWKQVHIYDFFCGPGSDPSGLEGSPVRIVQELLKYQAQQVANGITVHLHFSDSDGGKTIALRKKLGPLLNGISNVVLDVQALPFEKAFSNALPTLNSRDAAKLVLLDPCGVNFVDQTVFQKLIASKFTDFLFFLASSYLNRFREVDSIKLKIDRPDDFFHVHKVALEAFKSLIPPGTTYYLAPFSIKKGKNIYGIIFGTADQLGMDKFLTTAWGQAPSNGEANFDIHREDFRVANPFLPFDEISNLPTKLQAFEDALKQEIISGKCPDESAIVAICFEHGVKRQHAKPVLEALKKENMITCDFHVPQIKQTRKIVLNNQREIVI